MKKYQVTVHCEKTGEIVYEKEYYVQIEALADYNSQKRFCEIGFSVEMKTV